MRKRWGLVAAAMIVLGGASASNAQGVVAGGWSPQFGYRSFGTYSNNPYGWGGTGYGYSPYGYGGYQTGYPQSYGFSGYVAPPRVVNTLGPLGATIQRSTFSRRGR